MRISVVIPCYNSGAYLESAVESALAQTLRPFELLMLDDGSTNDTWARIEGLRSRHGALIRTFRRPANLGHGMRKELVGHALGDWIAFLDHDDLWAPEKLEKQVRAISRWPRVDFVHTDGWVQQADDVASRKLQDCPDYRGPADPFSALYFRNFVLASSALFPRSWVDRAGGLGQPRYSLVGDHEFWMRLSRAGARFARVGEPLVTWRIQRSGQISSRLLEHLRQLETMYADYERENGESGRIPRRRARRRLFKVQLDVIRTLLFREDREGHEEAAERWMRLVMDREGLESHRHSVARLLALARSEAPLEPPSAEAPRGRWRLPPLTPAESDALAGEWTKAANDSAARENIARETGRIFRMGGVNPPFLRIFETEEARYLELVDKAWGDLERRDRRGKWLHRT